MLHGEAIIYISSFTAENKLRLSLIQYSGKGKNLWNSIPEHLKNTKSQYSIKKKLKKYLLSQQCLENA